jgi:hypothetical protein
MKTVKSEGFGKTGVFLLVYALAMVAGSMAVLAQDITISPEAISKAVKVGDFVEVPIVVTNGKEQDITMNFVLEGDITRSATLNQRTLLVDALSENTGTLRLLGQNVSLYFGTLEVTGSGFSKKIQVNLSVTDEKGSPVEALALEIEPITERAKIGKVFDFKVSLINLLSDKKYNVTMIYSIDRLDDSTTYTFEKSFFEESETVELDTTQTRIKNFKMPDFIRPGRYVINVKAQYLGLDSSASRTFRVVEPFMDHLILGILPVRWVIFIGFFLVCGIGGYLYYLKKKAGQKRYVVKLDLDTLPKPGPRTIWLGYIAETNTKTYFDLEAFTTHSLIAGSTGGGKTVSAEVIVEEALEKGISVVVFDPTAQWSGFLRKNVDKRFLALYPKFGMKKTDARGYNGNVRQIMNAREIIDVKKYMKPGEISVFTINKLDPEGADILAANTIREVFHANFPESPELKLLIIFDEVHRLLPKYGGSGQGFIQIERAAREFRKWGVGLILISQVLKDFIGETKANINTEIQMRTRDQGDLDRIKTKYGGYMLQSLLKSATGVGMFENAQYNKGNPYFIALRPLKHMHARLTDDELDKYNKYNDILDELEFQIEMLEKEKIDVFDLKLEHKMALDKVKSGSFNMVDIYLEGLKPRIKTQWEKLGKEPPKKQARVVSEQEMMEEFKRAQDARKQFDEAAKKAGISTAAPGSQGPLKLGGGTYFVTSKTELLDALMAMDEGMFAGHVNASKNEIADWLIAVDKNAADKMRTAKTKAEAVAAITEFIPKQ